MEIEYIKDYRDINQEDDTVLVLGYFDGLHRGHKALFDKAREVANKEGLKVVVLRLQSLRNWLFRVFLLNYCFILLIQRSVMKNLPITV